MSLESFSCELFLCERGCVRLVGWESCSPCVPRRHFLSAELGCSRCTIVMGFARLFLVAGPLVAEGVFRFLLDLAAAPPLGLSPLCMSLVQLAVEIRSFLGSLKASLAVLGKLPPCLLDSRRWSATPAKPC